MNKNKSNNIIGSLVALIGVSLMAAVILIAFNRGSNIKSEFNKEKETTALNLYNSIMSIQEEKDYPKSPEEVMNIYNDGFLLLYGNMIKDEKTIPEIIHQQRKLLSNEILDLNAFEDQEKNLKETIEKFKEQNFYIVSIETKPVIYIDAASCYIRVIQRGNNFIKFYWNYYLEKDELTKLWKITGWEATDENFEALEIEEE